MGAEGAGRGGGSASASSVHKSHCTGKEGGGEKFSHSTSMALHCTGRGGGGQDSDILHQWLHIARERDQDRYRELDQHNSTLLEVQ